MNKKTKIWLIVAAFLVIIGGIIFAFAMEAYDWDFKKLNTLQYEENVSLISENFENISINTDTADVLLVPYEENACKVVCYESEKTKHTVEVHDNTLVISISDEREWYEHIGINIGSQKITVYLPEREYSNLHIETTTGDITLRKDLAFENIDASVNTGDVMVSALASDTLKVNTSTGDVHLDNCDAGEIFVETSTGDIEGRLLSEKVFIAKTSTGDIDVPKTIHGGRCELITSTGDIEIVTK